MLRSFVLLVLVIWNSSSVLAQQTLKYAVSFEQRTTHRIAVTMTIPSPATDSFELMMATWTPGSYLIREYSRHLDDVKPATGSDSATRVSKISKNRWRVQCVPGKDVTLHYEVYCREMSVRSNWVDSDMAILCGAAFVLTLPVTDPNAPKIEHQIQLHLPAEWSRAVTSLSLVDGQPNTFRAASFDELADSPMICGNPVLQDFDAGGSAHIFASLGDASLWDTSKAAADVQKIVLQQQAFWGTVPYRRYSVLNVISEASGGLEHDNSTLVMTSRWSFRDREKYEDWLSLISHEFFHTWNVRRLRPVNLTPYNYEQENYTRSLWIAEGLTSYYEDLMLIRAGLIDESAYLKRLSKQVEKLQSAPGRLVQSLAESSFDSWIKFYRPDENSSNTRVSYYVKGAVVGFLLDARIRELTGNQKSLDDVMRLLYQRHAGPGGFSDQQFSAIVQEVAGSDLSDWLHQHVEVAGDVDYTAALNWFGLQFPSDGTRMDQSAEPASPEAAVPAADAASKKSESKTQTVWTGWQTSDASGNMVVTGVLTDSPAHRSGLNVDDEILGFDQYRANAKSWRDQLNQFGVGRTIKVLISRRGELRTLSLQLEAEPSAKWSLRPVNKPTDEQTARRKAWLGSN